MAIKTMGQKMDNRSVNHMMKRMGLAGFSFFIIKGLLWILIPILTHLALFN